MHSNLLSQFQLEISSDENLVVTFILHIFRQRFFKELTIV